MRYNAAMYRATNLQKKLLFIALIAFVILSMPASASLAMPVGTDGHMSGCTFMNGGSICTMAPLEHIAAWQSMFTAAHLKEASLFLNLILITLFSVFLFLRRLDTSQLQNKSLYTQRFRYPRYSIRNELQEAFSSGILHPKVF